MTKLSVNINKIATLRNARGANLPDLIKTACDCERFGAQGITVHPRPDERHIRYQDVYDLKKVIRIAPREEIRENGLRHKAALIIVQNKKGHFLAVQRSKNKKVFPLMWIIGAGGGVPVGETYKTAAKRELSEELGIIAPLKLIFDFDYKSEITSYFAKVYLVNWDEKIKLNLEEGSKIKWATKEEVEKLAKGGELCPDTKLFFEKYINLPNSN